MAGSRGSGSRGRKKGSGSTGEGAAGVNSSGRDPDEGWEAQESEGDTESDSSDQRPGPDSGGGPGVTGEEQLDGEPGGHPEQEASKSLVVPDKYFLIYEELRNNKCFAVIESPNVTGIAMEASKMTPEVVQKAVLIKGKKVPFQLDKRVTFSSDGEDVVL